MNTQNHPAPPTLRFVIVEGMAAAVDAWRAEHGDVTLGELQEGIEGAVDFILQAVRRRLDGEPPAEDGAGQPREAGGS